jgi:hypothetical protein
MIDLNPLILKVFHLWRKSNAARNADDKREPL